MSGKQVYSYRKMKKAAKKVSKPKARKFTPKQLRFCQEYIIDQNATAAALRAGFSKNGVTSTAFNLMQFDHVKKKIAELQSKTATRLEITVEGIAKEYQQIVEANIVDFLDEDGGITNLKKLPREITAAIESIKVSSYFDKKENRVVNVMTFKLHNKNQALEALAKHLGFFERDNKQKSEIALKGFSWETLLQNHKSST